MKSFSYLIFISILFSCLGQVASDLYLPSLPEISIKLHTSISSVQLTVSSYMLGYALSFLIYGPLSDAFGRKQPLVGGVAIFLLGTVGCVLAHSINFLTVSRLLQGFGAGAGVVLGSTIIRDLADGSNLAKIYSYLGIANIVAIASAPFLGGYLQQFFGWHASFIVLLIYSLLALGVSVFFLEETNQHQTLENLKIPQIKHNLRSLFSNQQFISSIIDIFVLYGAILAWLTLGPIFLQDTIGLSPSGFGLVALIGGAFYAAGAFLNGTLVNKFGINNMLIFAAELSFLSGLIMLILGLLFPKNLLACIIPFFSFIFCADIIFPNAYAQALTPFNKIAGFAGAIIGFVQISGGVISSSIRACHQLSQTTLATKYTAPRKFCAVLS